MNEDQISKTGSVRKNAGKPKMSHIDPEFILGMAKVLTIGEKKYEAFNWAKGNNMLVPYDSAMRHILSYISGENLDEESGESHLFHAAVNLMFMYYYEKNFSDMDDRFFIKDKNE